MRLEVDGRPMVVPLGAVVVAGFTGRDEKDVRSHLDELAGLGVTVPDRVPAFYPVSPLLVTQANAISVWSEQTSGEAEMALVETGGERLVTLASDHTDRGLEARHIHAAKLACPKVVARRAWRFEEVAEHWDELRIRSWVDDGVLYQDGSAAELLPPDDLLARLRLRPGSNAVLVLAGTLPAIGSIRPGARFRAELADPVLGRRIELDYRVEVVGEDILIN